MSLSGPLDLTVAVDKAPGSGSRSFGSKGDFVGTSGDGLRAMGYSAAKGGTAFREVARGAATWVMAPSPLPGCLTPNGKIPAAADGWSSSGQPNCDQAIARGQANCETRFPGFLTIGMRGTSPGIRGRRLVIEWTAQLRDHKG